MSNPFKQNIKFYKVPILSLFDPIITLQDTRKGSIRNFFIQL